MSEQNIVAGILLPGPLILHDETGQLWAISVRPDGQLQTAKHPDGEPMTPGDYTNKSIMDALEEMARPPAPPAPSI